MQQSAQPPLSEHAKETSPRAPIAPLGCYRIGAKPRKVDASTVPTPGHHIHQEGRGDRPGERRLSGRLLFHTFLYEMRARLARGAHPRAREKSLQTVQT